MENFNWLNFKAALLLQGLTIVRWLKVHKIDVFRFYNIKYGKVKPTTREIKLFLEVIDSLNRR